MKAFDELFSHLNIILISWGGCHAIKLRKGKLIYFIILILVEVF